VPNELKQFSLGTKNKTLTYASDGSLTLYVQHQRRSANKLANWLPAPAEDFELFIRAYWPTSVILEHTWAPPPVLKSK
jgi:hypothetical protein